MVCVMVVNYCHITANIVYGCVSYRNVLSIGEHVYLEIAFGVCDIQAAKKGLHFLEYHFGFLHPNHHLPNRGLTGQSAVHGSPLHGTGPVGNRRGNGEGFVILVRTPWRWMVEKLYSGIHLGHR